MIMMNFIHLHVGSRRLLILFMLSLWFTRTGLAQQDSNDNMKTLTSSYLQAVWAADWEKMGSYLSEESIYQDFTMQYFGGDAIDLVGRDAIVAFYQEANDGSGVLEVRNDIVYHFVTGNGVVYELDTTVRAEGSYWEAPGIELTATFRVVSFVQMKEGKVVRHIDFSDYAEAMSQIKAQVEKTN